MSDQKRFEITGVKRGVPRTVTAPTKNDANRIKVNLELQGYTGVRVVDTAQVTGRKP